MGLNFPSALWAILGFALLHLVHAATFYPLLPPAYPLAVRNPYLSSTSSFCFLVLKKYLIGVSMATRKPGGGFAL